MQIMIIHVLSLWHYINYWLHERVRLEIVTPRKPESTEGSRSGNINGIIFNVYLLHHIHYVSFQNNPGPVNICTCVSYFHIFKRSDKASQNQCKSYVHCFCTVYNVWNITRCWAISAVAKFHYELGCGFMIQRLVLIFIISNPNQLLSWRSVKKLC